MPARYTQPNLSPRMLKRCVIYLRVSTAEQAAPGHFSLDAQELLCRKYAESHGTEVVEVLRDEGYSGLTTRRPGLRRLYEYIGTSPPVLIDAILVQDTSRMGRDTTEYLLFRRQLRERGIELVAVTQPNIDSSPEGRLVDLIIAGINQYHSEEKGRRASIAMQRKFEDGWWPGWAPLGYINVDRDGRRRVDPDPDCFNLVQFAFREYATGRYAQEQLCNVLSDKGLRNRNGLVLSRTNLNRMLASPFYFGLMQWRDQERIGRHEPATDRPTWERCQQVTAEHNRYAPRTRKHTFILTGLTVCAACGNHHTHTVNAAKRKRYYHCKSTAKCSEPYIPQTDLERQVTALVQGIHLTDEFIDRVVAKVRQVFEKRTGTHEREKHVLLRRQSILEQRRNAAEEKLLSGLLSDEAFKRHVPKVQAELSEVQRRLQELEQLRGLDTEALREILSFARDIPKAYGDAPPELKRHYLEFFFRQLAVEDRRIVRVVPAELFAALMEGDQVRTPDVWRKGWDSNPRTLLTGSAH